MRHFLTLLLVLSLAVGAFAQDALKPGTVLWANPLDNNADLAASSGVGECVAIDGRNVLKFDKPSVESSHLRRFDLPVAKLRGKRIYLSAGVKAANVTAKPNSWNGIKVMLKVTRPGGIDWPQLDLPVGTFDWRRGSTRITVPADATAIELITGLELVSGTVWLDDLRIALAHTLRQAPAAPPDQPIFKGHNLPALRGAMAHPRITRESLKHFAERWGGNVIRYQLVQFPKGDDIGSIEAYDRWLAGELAYMDNVLKWAHELGVLVVVDLHSPPAGKVSESGMASGSGSFWTDRAAQDHFVAVWQRITTHCKGKPVIWAFDLMNEPDDRSVIEGCDDWQTLADRAARAVRQIDPDRTLIVESPMWGSGSGFEGFQPLDLPRIVYSFHMYTPYEYTHQNVYNKVEAIAYPGKIAGRMWDKAALEESMAPAIRFAKRYRVQMYIGEFSAIRWAPGAEQYLADVTAIFESHGWDWTYHAYREWQGWSLEHGTDRNDNEPAAQPGKRMEAIMHWMKQNRRDIPPEAGTDDALQP